LEKSKIALKYENNTYEQEKVIAYKIKRAKNKIPSFKE
jgi:hypothetical protein